MDRYRGNTLMAQTMEGVKLQKDLFFVKEDIKELRKAKKSATSRADRAMIDAKLQAKKKQRDNLLSQWTN